MGLHTRYKDFIENYIKPDVNDDSNIKEFKRYLQSKENIQLWSDAEIGMGTHLGDFSDENFQISIPIIIIDLSHSIIQMLSIICWHVRLNLIVTFG